MIRERMFDLFSHAYLPSRFSLSDVGHLVRKTTQMEMSFIDCFLHAGHRIVLESSRK